MRETIRSLILLCVLLGVASCVSTPVAVKVTETPMPDEWYFDSITFEIAAISTACLPNLDALDTFRDRLHENRLCRKGNVRFVIHPVSQSMNPTLWNSTLLTYYERNNRTVLDQRPDDRQFFVFVSYISGAWLDDGGLKFLGGIQYTPSAFAIFKDSAADRESGVLLHEFGHLIGMVKNKARDNHDDDHKHHCANKRCAMFWTAPGPDSDFDYYCKRYIRRKLAERALKAHLWGTHQY